MKNLMIGHVLALGALAALWGCARPVDPASQARAAPAIPYTIVATTGMVADIVRQVAGERATVSGLMGEGVDPHLYKPSAADVRKILGADVIFYNGLMLEGRMGDTFVKAAREGRPVYAVTELIDESFLLEPEQFQGHWDPHVWMDASAWARCAEAVARALCDFDPAGAESYRRHAAALAARLDALHAYVRTVIASIPREQRVLITAHDAFNYFGRAYDIEVMGIQGISTESEAGLDDVNRLVDLIVARRVRGVFVETSVSDRYVRALIEGARARGHELVVGGSLFSDAMGQPGTYRGTYVGMMDHNATTIALALGGEAPQRGMNGEL
jgi:manganese/zinc/iron transport system substrate-binding protein